jgi:hypothetical protein
MRRAVLLAIVYFMFSFHFSFFVVGVFVRQSMPMCLIESLYPFLCAAYICPFQTGDAL